MKDKFVVRLTAGGEVYYLFGLQCQSIDGPSLTVEVVSSIDGASKRDSVEEAKLIRDGYIENIKLQGYTTADGSEAVNPPANAIEVSIVKVAFEDVLTQVLVKA